MKKVIEAKRGGILHRFGGIIDKKLLFIYLAGFVLLLQYFFFTFYAEWTYHSDFFRGNKVTLDSLVLSAINFIVLVGVYKILGARMKNKIAKQFYSIISISSVFSVIAISLYMIFAEQIGLWRYGSIIKVSLLPVAFIILPIQAIYLFYWRVVFVRGNRIRYVLPQVEIFVFLLFSFVSILAIIVGLYWVITSGGP